MKINCEVVSLVKGKSGCFVYLEIEVMENCGTADNPNKISKPFPITDEELATLKLGKATLKLEAE